MKLIAAGKLKEARITWELDERDDKTPNLQENGDIKEYIIKQETEEQEQTWVGSKMIIKE